MSYSYYFLQVNIYLIVFYAFYRLMLNRETYFRLNRWYLVSSGLLSLIIPFLRPQWFVRQAATRQLETGILQLNTVFTEVVSIPAEVPKFSWWQLLPVIYILGSLFFAIRLIVRLIYVKRLIKSKAGGMAFSFFNIKMVDDTLPGAETINKHEEIHIRHFHSMDVLFFELLNILFWCNPVIYMYKTAIKDIHEYYADEVSARYLGDKESYAMLLLSKTFGVDQDIITNRFFNQSFIKKRISMLYQNRSKRVAILKYGLFLPLFALTLFLSSATVANNSELKVAAAQLSEVIGLPGLVPPGFYRHMSRSLRYPPEALEKKLQGNSMVKFTVKAGEVNDLGVHTPLGSGCDAEVMKAILSFMDFPSVEDGKYSLPVSFKIEDAGTPVINSNIVNPEGYIALEGVSVTASGKEDILYQFGSSGMQIQPEFRGGITKFYRYLIDNYNYPAGAKENKAEGRTDVSFMVGTTGKVTNVKLSQKLGYGIDQEVIRLLEESQWAPGIQHGRHVKVSYNIPLMFSVNKEGIPVFIPGQVKMNGVVGKTIPALLMIDGKKMQKGTFVMPVSEDIKTLKLLTEEQAMQAYGQDGKNGAVVITTKK